jgi:ankyrin repeat protein
LAKDKHGKTLWHEAAKYVKTKVLQQLWDWAEPLDIDRKSILLAKDKHGKTLWHEAAASSQGDETLEKLWGWGMEKVDNQPRLTDKELKENWLLSKDERGKNAWHWTAERGNVALLEKLWAWAKEVKAEKDLLLSKDSYGKIAWNRAEWFGKPKVLEKLWAWAKAVEIDKEELKNWLLAKHDKGKTVWHWAAASFQGTETLEKLWGWGMEKVDNQPRLTDKEIKENWLLSKDEREQTAWHEALEWENLEVIEKFWSWAKHINAGRDLLLAKNDQGRTAWHWVVERGNLALLEKFCAWGTEIVDGQPRLTDSEINEGQKEAKAKYTPKADISLLQQDMCSIMSPIEQLAGTTRTLPINNTRENIFVENR